MINKICIAGAGTMGSGIALSAALAGYDVILFDLNTSVLTTAKDSINKNLLFLSDRKKITIEDSKSIFNKILFTSSIKDAVADLVIEAIIENMAAKVSLLEQVASINSSHCILASNTSSLSVSELQNRLPYPGRVAGMHFFNPAHLMKLVEIVRAEHTTEEVVEELVNVAKNLGKTPVICKDAPGFIVNRVARHYYLEAMKLVELNIATFENVDEVMEASGFKMGPFRLMDLIGMDINYAVSESLYKALNEPDRLKPSEIQKEKVEKGELGRKTGKGFYNY